MTGRKVQYDAVRAYKRVDIFDCYYARLKAYNGKMLHISVAGGYISPSSGLLPRDLTHDILHCFASLSSLFLTWALLVSFGAANHRADHRG